MEGVALAPHTHSRCRRTRTALARDAARRNAGDAVVAEEEGKAVCGGRQSWWGGWQDGVAGWVGWRAGSGGWQGRVAGRVRRLAGW